jgi:alpha-tubulin suppressor-like RCC1 family protein
VTTGGVAYCWGANNFGALGDGTTNNSMVPVKVAGQP